jgi:GNAT superfamily N-acetyltransferase
MNWYKKANINPDDITHGNEMTYRELKNEGLGELGREWLGSGADPFYYQGEIAGYVKYEDNYLSGFELLPKFRRQGIGEEVIRGMTLNGRLLVFMPSDDMLKLLGRVGEVDYNTESGLALLEINSNPQGSK